MTVIVILADTRYEWNRHIWDVRPSLFEAAGQIAFAAKMTFALTAAFIRISLLLFYYRLVKDSSIVWFTWALHASMAFQMIIGITFVALTIWQCE